MIFKVGKVLSIGIMLGLNGCALFHREPKPLLMAITQHSPLRLYVNQKVTEEGLEQILLLPPMGNIDAATQQSFHEQLFSSAQRHFITPIRVINANSAYAPYIAENNLIAGDGTLNLQEIVILGRLMNATHVICPYIREIKQYAPQRLSLHITVIDILTAEAPVELSGVFDANESDVRQLFYKYAKLNKKGKESKFDLMLKIHSPSTYRAFVSEVCCNVMAENLPF